MFRLERVRALRERHEDEAKAQLAGAMAQRADAQDAAHEAAARVEKARAQFGDAPAGAVDLLSRQAYLERVERAHRTMLGELQRHDANVAGRRDALTEAAQARQALERLKEHRLADFQREAARKDAVTLDEIAINGFRRRAAA